LDSRLAAISVMLHGTDCQASRSVAATSRRPYFSVADRGGVHNILVHRLLQESPNPLAHPVVVGGKEEGAGFVVRAVQVAATVEDHRLALQTGVKRPAIQVKAAPKLPASANQSSRSGETL